MKNKFFKTGVVLLVFIHTSLVKAQNYELPPASGPLLNYYETFGGQIVLKQGFHVVANNGVAFRAKAYPHYFSDLASFEEPQLKISNGYQYNPVSNQWTFYGQSGISGNGSGFTYGMPNAPNGNQVLFLQNLGYATADFYVAQAGYYRVRLKAAKRLNCCGPQDKSLKVYLAGYEVGEFEVNSTSYQEKITLPIYLTAGTNHIKLEGYNQMPGDRTVFVDDLTLQKLDSWHDPASWLGGIVPTATVNALIPSGKTIVVGDNVQAKSIRINGQLIVAQNKNLTLETNYIQLDTYHDALFQIGRELTPYNGSATITFNGGQQQSSAAMGDKYLGAMRGTIDIHGEERKSWTKLAASVSSNATSITLIESVDWRVGDQIMIAPSGPNFHEDEMRTISNISNGNKTIHFSQPLSYSHLGVQRSYNSGAWVAELRAEVGLLSRNIKIQGDNSGPAGFGGHIMIMHSGKAFMEGVELYNMGQKKEAGRYPFHWHMIGNNGAQQYFRNSSVHHSNNRGITIHDTNSTLVENNVFYHQVGHCVFLEDGTEENTRILNNLVVKTLRPASFEDAMTPSDFGVIPPQQPLASQDQNRSPASYWITHPNNTVEGNVAAGTEGTGYWYIFRKSTSWDKPFGSFTNNTAHSCNSGFDIFDRLSFTTAEDHVININIGWLDPGQHLISNCLWYANTVGVYSGSGHDDSNLTRYNRAPTPFTENLIFHNNIFIDNWKNVMLASHNVVDNSLFVADDPDIPGSGGTRMVVFAYDGAPTIKNSHLIGFDGSNASFSRRVGASVRTGNITVEGLTMDNPPIVQWAPGGNTEPIVWNTTIWDKDGSITGNNGARTIIPNKDFVLMGQNEHIPNGWSNAYVTTRRYVNTRLVLPVVNGVNDGVLQGSITRSKPGTSNVTSTFTDQQRAHLPLIVNDPDVLYTYDLSLSNLSPVTKMLGLYLYNPLFDKDYLIVKFNNFTTLTGLAIQDDDGPLTVYGSLSNLKASANSGYAFIGTDLYLKAMAKTNRKFQGFHMTWTSNGSGNRHASEVNTEADIVSQQTSIQGPVIYPNPTNSALYMNGVSEGEPFRITDLTGRIILNDKYQGAISLRGLHPGTYLVTVMNKTIRFLKE